MPPDTTRAERETRDAPPPPDAERLAYWRSRAARAVRLAGTPCFVFGAEALAAQAAELEAAFAGLPVRHWWSFKTLPLRKAVEAWRAAGRGVEVVSEFELRTVLDLGSKPDQILVNGPAKHAWLKAFPVQGLRVNFDSVEEIRALRSRARRLKWRVGVRLSMPAEDNFEYPGIRAQFGLLEGELAVAARLLRTGGLPVEVVHFHLRTNVPEPRYYAEAVDDAVGRARAVGWNGRIVDIGGGFPPARILTRRGAPVDAGFSLAAQRTVLAAVVRRHGLEEVWMENGRWLAAPAAVLAVRVLDAKADRGARVLICDGGRTLGAMVATWERHALVPLRPRGGPVVPTVVHGPTCMAFDNLGVHRLPAGVKTGDVLLWCEAGAYQTAWETRFSHGLAAIAWAEGRKVGVVRPREGYESWSEDH